MLDLVMACFIGIGIGTCTGMVPGIHVNTAGAIMFASSAFLMNYISAEFLCIVFVSMSIAHIVPIVSMTLNLLKELRTSFLENGFKSFYSKKNVLDTFRSY